MSILAFLSTQVIDTTTVGRAVMTAADAAAARTAIGAAATSHTHAASDIVSGIIGTARLATGTASASTYLRGDQTWATVAGGMAIGSSVTSATAGSIFFAGAAGILAQDNASLFFDDANNRLGVGTAAPTQPLDVSNTGTAGQIRYRWASDQSLGFGGDGTQGPYVVSHTNPNDTSFGAYAAIKLNFGSNGFIVSNSPGTSVGAARTFSELCRISTTTQIGLLTCTSASLKGLVVKAAASQTANLQEWQNSSGTALSLIRPNGGIGVASLADADAANSTLYYSTDAATLVWKNASGVVNNLY